MNLLPLYFEDASAWWGVKAPILVADFLFLVIITLVFVVSQIFENFIETQRYLYQQ